MIMQDVYFCIQQCSSRVGHSKKTVLDLKSECPSLLEHCCMLEFDLQQITDVEVDVALDLQ